MLKKKIRHYTPSSTQDDFNETLLGEINKCKEWYRQELTRLRGQLQFLSQRTNFTRREEYEYKQDFLAFHRACKFLGDFQILNRVAVHKICKKYQKYIGDNTGATNDIIQLVDQDADFNPDNVDQLLGQCEQTMANLFYHGDLRRALRRLRQDQLALERLREKGSDVSSGIRAGFLYGVGVVLFLETFIGFHLQSFAYHILFAYGALGMVVLMITLFGWCLYVWHHRRINYIFIFEWDPRSVLSTMQYMEIASMLFASLALCFRVSCGPLTSDLMFVSYLPLVWTGFWLFVLLLPFKLFWYYSRLWVLRQLRKVTVYLVSRPVLFSDFFMMDMALSLSFFWAAVYVAGCGYVSERDTTMEQCMPNKNWIPSLLIGWPFCVRAIQCLRRVYDDPQLNKRQWVNFGKYTVSILAILSAAVSSVENISIAFYIWTVLVAVSTVYSSWWDIQVDWGLRKSQAGDRPRTFPRWLYVLVSCLDVVLRMAWISTLNAQFIVYYGIWSFSLGLLEVIRRCMWALVRVENEHANNIENYRAVREIPMMPITASGDEV